MDFLEIEPAQARALTASRAGELLAQAPLLVRGAPWPLGEFESWTRQICDSFHNVGSRQRLRQQQGDGKTTQVFEANFVLLGHSEGVYRPFPPPPDVCFFMCLVPPSAPGGETTVIDGLAMVARLDRTLKEVLQRARVTYGCRWEPQRWRAEFEIDSPPALSRLLATLPGCIHAWHGEVLELAWTTNVLTRSSAGDLVFANGMLAHLPRVIHSRYAGRPVYVNPTNSVLLDGDPIADEVVNALIDAHDETMVAHRWRAGDILILDNTRFMHGRESTAEPCAREIISRFGRRSSSAADRLA